VIDPAILAFSEVAEPAPLREATGLRWCEDADGVVQALDVTPWLLEDDGSVSIGALAVLADSTIGTVASVRGGFGSGATVGLRVELVAAPLRRLPTVLADVDVVHADASGSLALANLRDVDGDVLGVATQRNLARATLAVGSRPGRSDSDRADPSNGAPAGLDIDDVLGVARIERADGRSALRYRPGRVLANGGGRLHGGIVAALVQRGCRHATSSLVGAVGDLVLDVDFPRPVPAGDSTLEIRGHVVERTRRYAWAAADLVLPDGRIAARGRVVAEIANG